MNKQCKSYEQENTFLRARGQEIGQVFLAITLTLQKSKPYRRPFDFWLWKGCGANT